MSTVAVVIGVLGDLGSRHGGQDDKPWHQDLKTPKPRESHTKAGSWMPRGPYDRKVGSTASDIAVPRSCFVTVKIGVGVGSCLAGIDAPGTDGAWVFVTTRARAGGTGARSQGGR